MYCCQCLVVVIDLCLLVQMWGGSQSRQKSLRSDWSQRLNPTSTTGLWSRLGSHEALHPPPETLLDVFPTFLCCPPENSLCALIYPFGMSWRAWEGILLEETEENDFTITNLMILWRGYKNSTSFSWWKCIPTWHPKAKNLENGRHFTEAAERTECCTTQRGSWIYCRAWSNLTLWRWLSQLTIFAGEKLLSLSRLLSISSQPTSPLPHVIASSIRERKRVHLSVSRICSR